MNSVPRLWSRLLGGASAPWRARLETWRPRFVALWIAGIALAALAVHPAFHRWSATQAEIREERYHHRVYE